MSELEEKLNNKVFEFAIKQQQSALSLDSKAPHLALFLVKTRF